MHRPPSARRTLLRPLLALLLVVVGALLPLLWHPRGLEANSLWALLPVVVVVGLVVVLVLLPRRASIALHEGGLVVERRDRRR
jgi:hypothetical protein